MNKIFQTDFGEKTGNCMEACIASLFELKLDQVPKLDAGKDNSNWFDALNVWLKKNFQCFYVELKWADEIPEGFCIIVGQSPRYDCKHAVVGYGDKIVHDPVGIDREGYMELADKKNWGYGYFISFDPMSFGDLFLDRYKIG